MKNNEYTSFNFSNNNLKHEPWLKKKTKLAFKTFLIATMTQ